MILTNLKSKNNFYYKEIEINFDDEIKCKNKFTEKDNLIILENSKSFPDGKNLIIDHPKFKEKFIGIKNCYLIIDDFFIEEKKFNEFYLFPCIENMKQSIKEDIKLNYKNFNIIKISNCFLLIKEQKFNLQFRLTTYINIEWEKINNL